MTGFNLVEIKTLPKEQRDEMLSWIKKIEGITHRQAARILASHLTLFLNRRKQKNRPLASNDIDDDPEPFGNGYNDETEVVSLAPNSIQANTDYRFESYFNVYSESNDPTFAFTSQESEDTIYGEYNVATKNGVSLFQTHQTRSYPW